MAGLHPCKAAIWRRHPGQLAVKLTQKSSNTKILTQGERLKRSRFPLGALSHLRDTSFTIVSHDKLSLAFDNFHQLLTRHAERGLVRARVNATRFAIDAAAKIACGGALLHDRQFLAPAFFEH